MKTEKNDIAHFEALMYKKLQVAKVVMYCILAFVDL